MTSEAHITFNLLPVFSPISLKGPLSVPVAKRHTCCNRSEGHRRRRLRFQEASRGSRAQSARVRNWGKHRKTPKRITNETTLARIYEVLKRPGPFILFLD